jgi:hypothetical protein
VECLVADQALAGSNPFDPITFLFLNSMRYAPFSTAISTSFLIFVDNTDNVNNSRVFAWKFEPLLRASH